VKSVFFEVINASATSMCSVKITLHYSVYMRASDEKERISDKVECVQSVSYSHIRSLSGLCAVVDLREGKRDTCLGAPFATVM